MWRCRFNSYDLNIKDGITRRKCRTSAGKSHVNKCNPRRTRIVALGSCAAHDEADDTGSAQNGIARNLPPLEVVWLARAPGPFVPARGTKPDFDDLAPCDGLPAPYNDRAALRLQKHISIFHEKKP